MSASCTSRFGPVRSYRAAAALLLLFCSAAARADSLAYPQTPFSLPSLSPLDLSPNGTLVDPATGGLSVPALAAALNLSLHWAAPVPSLSSLPAAPVPADAEGGNASSAPPPAMYAAPAAQSLEWLSRSWSLWNSRLYGGDGANLGFVADPFASLLSVPGPVLKVEYGKGTYKQSGPSGSGGATFYPSPPQLGLAKRVLLNYQVAFDPAFDWVKGGKLPGLWSGRAASDCSGGKKGTDGDCFSVRLMWRAGGAGEVYAYLPEKNNLCPSTPAGGSNSSNASLSSGVRNSVICNDDYGTSISRGSFNFTRGLYTNVTIYLQLNTPSLADGVLKVWAGSASAQPVVDMDSLVLLAERGSSPIRLFFSSFFGGSSPDWASAADTRSYFKDLQIWTDAPILDKRSGAVSSRLGRLATGWRMAIALLILAMSSWAW